MTRTRKNKAVVNSPYDFTGTDVDHEIEIKPLVTTANDEDSDEDEFNLMEIASSRTKLRNSKTVEKPSSEKTVTTRRKSARLGGGKLKLGTPSGNNETLYCICRQPFGDRFMIECDTCHEWYHGDCIGLSLHQGKQIEKRNEEYVCEACKEKVNSQESDKSSLAGEEDDESISLAAIRKQSKMTANKQEERVKSFSELLAEAAEGSLDRADGQDGNDSCSEGNDDASTVDNGEEATDYEDNNSESSLPSAVELSDVKMEVAHFDNIKELLASDKNTEKEDSPSTSVDDNSKNSEETEALASNRQENVEEKEKLPQRKAKPKYIPVTAIATQQVPVPVPSKRTKDNITDSGRCFVGGCDNRPMPASIYCSPECLRAHCQQSVSLLRKAQAHLQGTSGSQPTELRLSVIDAKTGRFINDHKKVNENTIEKFISKHPTFRIVAPQATPSMLAPQQSQPLSTSSASTSSTSAVNSFRLTVRTELRDALKQRVDGAEDALFSIAEIGRTALRIEDAMYKQLGGAGSEKYKQRFRSLILNIKDSRNRSLFRRILLGSLSPHELATTPAERLASEELAQWREQQRKKSLEMLIGDASKPAAKPNIASSAPLSSKSQGASTTSGNSTTTSAISHNLPTRTITHADLSSLDETFSIDTTANHRSHLFDVNCKLCTGKSDSIAPASAALPRPVASATPSTSKSMHSAYAPLAREVYSRGNTSIATSQPSTLASTAKTTSSYPAESSSVYFQVGSVGNTTTVTSSTTSPKPISSWRRSPSMKVSAEKSPESPKMFGSPGGNYSPPRPQIDIEWSGKLKLDPTACPMPINGRLISITQNAHLDFFPDTLEIIGKLATPAVWDYLDKIRRSINKEILVVFLEPTTAPESLTTYRSLLSSLKDKGRYAVIRTAQLQALGSCKDIYLTYTNTDWLRRLVAYGMKFTEQLPLESKLACVLVRYTGSGASVPISQPSQKEVARAEENTKDAEEEEDYDPSNFLVARKPAPSDTKTKQPSTKKVSTEQPSYVPPQPSSKPQPEKTTGSASSKPVLSTPEEVSSVSELIRRILGSSSMSPLTTALEKSTGETTTTTKSAETTASKPAMTSPSKPTVVTSEIAGDGQKDVVTIPTSPISATPVVTSSAEAHLPIGIPPPPPGMVLPPFPVSGPLVPPPTIGNVMDIPTGMPPPGMPPPPPHMMPPLPNVGVPPGSAPPLGSQKPPQLMVPPPQLALLQPPPQLALPPPPTQMALMPLSVPQQQQQQQPPTNAFTTGPPQPPPGQHEPFPLDPHVRREAEREIWNYLDQLLDEALPLGIRSNVLQEFAVFLRNPVNEQIVRQSPEFTEKFQRAVAIVNSVAPSQYGPPNGAPESRPPAPGTRSALLPTPQHQPRHQRPPSSDSRPGPPLSMPHLPPPHLEGAIPPPLFKPAKCYQPLSEWRLLLRMYKKRAKGGHKQQQSATSSAPKSAAPSYGQDGQRNSYPGDSDGVAAKRSRPSDDGSNRNFNYNNDGRSPTDGKDSSIPGLANLVSAARKRASSGENGGTGGGEKASRFEDMKSDERVRNRKGSPAHFIHDRFDDFTLPPPLNNDNWRGGGRRGRGRSGSREPRSSNSNIGPGRNPVEPGKKESRFASRFEGINAGERARARNGSPAHFVREQFDDFTPPSSLNSDEWRDGGRRGRGRFSSREPRSSNSNVGPGRSDCSLLAEEFNSLQPGSDRYIDNSTGTGPGRSECSLLAEDLDRLSPGRDNVGTGIEEGEICDAYQKYLPPLGKPMMNTVSNDMRGAQFQPPPPGFTGPPRGNFPRKRGGGGFARGGGGPAPFRGGRGGRAVKRY